MYHGSVRNLAFRSYQYVCMLAAETLMQLLGDADSPADVTFQLHCTASKDQHKLGAGGESMYSHQMLSQSCDELP